MAFKLLKEAEVKNPVGVVVRIENDRGGSTAKGGWSLRGGRTYQTRLKVQTDSPYVGPIQIIQSVAPVWGAYYQWPLSELGGGGPGKLSLPLLPVEQDTGSFLQDITCDPDPEATDGKQWILTLDYGPFDVKHELGDSGTAGVIDPLLKPLDVSWNTAKYERHKPEDESDPPQPYLNTAGDPLLDTPELEESRQCLTIVRNEPVYNQTYVTQYIDHVNKDTFLGFPPNTAKCKDITAKREYLADWGYYWIVTYEFEFRDDPDGNGWDKLITNEGYRELRSGVRKEVIIDGMPITSPVLLQEDGTYTDGADPHYLTFKLFKTATFADFNFPEDLLTQNQ